jgi:nucleotide-binding universal stress UspA family protein
VIVNKQILVALDSGQAAQSALKLSARLAGALHASLVLIRVLRPSEPEAPVRAALAAIGTELAADGIRARYELRTAVPAAVPDEILALAAALPANLIVMGSRARPTVAELLFGSVSTKVVSRSRCPVLVVRSGNGQSQATPRLIVLALEGDEGSESLLAVTEDLARALNAAVHVAHVSYPGGDQLERSIYHARQTHGEQALATALERLRRAGVAATSVQLVNRDGIARELARYAEQTGADLIVVGLHEETRTEERVLGTLPHAVIRRGKRPVLVTKEDHNRNDFR